jgi:hypothetical protein
VKRLEKLHPALAAAVRAAAADLAARGITIEVVQGLRSFEEQDALFAKGRTQPGPIVTQARGGESNHNYGLAADLCPFVDGKPDWNAPIAVWAAIGDAASRHGLEWGGQWKKFLDKPHVQLPLTMKECLACYRDGGLDAVWSTASTKVGWTGGGRSIERPGPARRTRLAVKRSAGRRRRARSRRT